MASTLRHPEGKDQTPDKKLTSFRMDVAVTPLSILYGLLRFKKDHA